MVPSSTQCNWTRHFDSRREYERALRGGNPDENNEKDGQYKSTSTHEFHSKYLGYFSSRIARSHGLRVTVWEGATVVFVSRSSPSLYAYLKVCRSLE
jgi:hypothetical protein